MTFAGCGLVVILSFREAVSSLEGSAGRPRLNGKDESSGVSPSPSYPLGSESSGEVHSDDVDNESAFVKLVFTRLLDVKA